MYYAFSSRKSKGKGHRRGSPPHGHAYGHYKDKGRCKLVYHGKCDTECSRTLPGVCNDCMFTCYGKKEFGDFHFGDGCIKIGPIKWGCHGKHKPPKHHHHPPPIPQPKPTHDRTYERWTRRVPDTEIARQYGLTYYQDDWGIDYMRGLTVRVV